MLKVLYQKSSKLNYYNGGTRLGLVRQAKEMGLEDGFEIFNILALSKFIGRSIPYIVAQGQVFQKPCQKLIVGESLVSEVHVVATFLLTFTQVHVTCRAGVNSDFWIPIPIPTPVPLKNSIPIQFQFI